MTRILCVLLVLAATSARAEGKRPLAVLGVTAKWGAAFSHEMKLAREITQGLHAAAGAKTSDYRVKGTPKQVEAALLTAECNAIEPACAAKLGAELGADYAIAAELERRGTRHVLVIALVEVATKRRVHSSRHVITSVGEAKKLAKAAFLKLTGGELGKLELATNAKYGDVLLDGQIVAGLFDGRTTLDHLVKGTHLLTIRATGFRAIELELEIESSTKQMILLDPL